MLAQANFIAAQSDYNNAQNRFILAGGRNILGLPSAFPLDTSRSNTADASTKIDPFLTLFSKLPIKLRLKIWKAALENH
jgi:hypothetical protein